MSINSTALQGLTAQSQKFAGHAQNIAALGTARPSADPSENAGRLPDDILTLGGESVTLEGEIVGAITAKHAYSANAKLIGLQRDMERELLNILS